MRNEFGFDKIASVEFCVSVKTKGANANYLVPTDNTVQEALKQVLDATVSELEANEDGLSSFELSEKYGSKEALRADINTSEMAAIKGLYEEESWDINSRILSDPAKISYYFSVFRDTRGRKLIGVRQATQFKGAFKGHFISIIDDTLRMIQDHVFKLDNQFDFLVTASHAYILHPAGFERVAEIEEFASEKAKEMTLGLAKSVSFLDFSDLSEFVGKHKRAARLIATLNSRKDLGSIQRARFCRLAAATGVLFVTKGRKLIPQKGSELGVLELLDNRRYITDMQAGAKPAFVASSRRPVRSGN